MRKGEQAREEMVKDVNEWPNFADVREANINVVGNWRMPVLGDLNERALSFEEVAETVNEMKSGKAPGLDGFPVECLKKGGMVPLWTGVVLV